MYKLGFREAKETEIKLQIFVGSWRKQGSWRKTSVSLTTLKPLTLWIITNWNIPKETGIPDHLTCLLKNLYARQGTTVRTGHGMMDWFQNGKGVCQSCIFYPFYLTYMQSTSWEMLDWMKHKLESRLLGDIPITSDMQMTPPLWQSEEKLKSLLMRVKVKKLA